MVRHAAFRFGAALGFVLALGTASYAGNVDDPSADNGGVTLSGYPMACSPVTWPNGFVQNCTPPSADCVPVSLPSGDIQICTPPAPDLADLAASDIMECLPFTWPDGTVQKCSPEALKQGGDATGG
jgi:hypothetical protein